MASSTPVWNSSLDFHGHLGARIADPVEGFACYPSPILSSRHSPVHSVLSTRASILQLLAFFQRQGEHVAPVKGPIIHAYRACTTSSRKQQHQYQRLQPGSCHACHSCLASAAFSSCFCSCAGHSRNSASLSPRSNLSSHSHGLQA